MVLASQHADRRSISLRHPGRPGTTGSHVGIRPRRLRIHHGAPAARPAIQALVSRHGVDAAAGRRASAAVLAVELFPAQPDDAPPTPPRIPRRRALSNYLEHRPT